MQLIRWVLETRTCDLMLKQQALLPTEYAFAFCFWILIVTVGTLLASSFGMTRSRCGTEDMGAPSVAANTKHLDSILMTCPFKVLTQGIPRMAWKKPMGLAVLSHLVQTDI